MSTEMSDEEFMNSFDNNQNLDAEQERERVHQESNQLQEDNYDFDQEEPDELLNDGFEDFSQYVDPRSDEYQGANHEEEDLEDEDDDNDDDDDYDFDDLDDSELEDDRPVVTNIENETSQESLIQSLKDKGYKIEAPEDEDSARISSMNQVDKQIDNINRVIALPREDFLRVAISNQLVKDYTDSGKSSLLNSPEFEEELNERIGDMKLNPSFENIFVNTQLQGLENLLHQTKEKKSKLNQEHEAVLTQRANLLKEETRKTVIDLSKKYGFKKSEAKEFYGFMMSDEFKKIVDNPSFVVKAVIAELAERKGRKLFTNDDNYSRGVKDTLDDIKGNGGGRSSNSQLGNQTRGTLGVPGNFDQNVWAKAITAEVDKEAKKKDVRVAGRFR